MSTITPDEYFERIHRIVSLLDDENTRIIQTMKEQGPRNILHIARESKRSEIRNLMTLISHLARDGILTGYHYSEIDPTTIQTQTFAYKYYDDKTGWRYDNRAYLGSLDNLLSTWPKSESPPAFLEASAAIASQ